MSTKLMQEIEKGIKAFKSSLNDLENLVATLYEKAFRTYLERDEKEYLDKLNCELFQDKRSILAKSAFRACCIISSPDFDPEIEAYDTENFQLYFNKKAGIHVGRHWDRQAVSQAYKEACEHFGKDQVILALMSLPKAKKPSEDPIAKAISFLRNINESYSVSLTMSMDDLPKEHKANMKKLESYCKLSGNSFKQFHDAMELLSHLR